MLASMWGDWSMLDAGKAHVKITGTHTHSNKPKTSIHTYTNLPANVLKHNNIRN